MKLQQALDKVIQHQSLSREEMTAAMRLIMTGEATPAQIGGFLVGLRMKSESVDEITAAAEVMRELATPVAADKTHLVDIVGTGGDGANLFNVSTCSSFVVAAAGGRVAKHGNRSVSSSSGSADLLESAGIALNLSPASIARCIDEVGVGFMFAPQHHSAMKHAIGPRREMGVRTLFNILGPLTNPAAVKHQLLGVFTPALVRPMAEVLLQLGMQHAWVVCADDGLDEISIAQPTQVAEVKDGQISEFVFRPEQVGIERQPLDSLKVDSAAASLQLVRQVLSGQAGPARDMVLLNAGAALYVADVADSIEEGVAMAQAVLSNGQALDKLKQLAALSSQLAEPAQ